MAEQQQLLQCIRQLDGRLATLEKALSAAQSTEAAVKAITDAVSRMSTSSPVPTVTSLPLPDKFSGDGASCRGFISQCSMQMELLATRFPTERAKVGFIVSLLSGKAFEWATPLWERGDPEVRTAAHFLTAIKQVFLGPRVTHDTSLQLLALTQGALSVSQYSVRFRTLASELEWSDKAPIPVFWRGLAEHVKDALSTKEGPASLEELIAISTRIDLRFSEHVRERAQSKRKVTPTPNFFEPLELPEPEVPPPEPIEVSRTVLQACPAQDSSRGLICQHAVSQNNSAPQRPNSVPPGKTLVPPHLRPKVLAWAHTSRRGGHCGYMQTTKLLAGSYWWPHRARDVKKYIRACAFCARNSLLKRRAETPADTWRRSTLTSAPTVSHGSLLRPGDLATPEAFHMSRVSLSSTGTSDLPADESEAYTSYGNKLVDSKAQGGGP
ncbi:uncharacterized protein [Dendrobates tinctorius]|uniref:uncharacterized protein n=1 Tax=Dendrobates tinctorius TaxID=92724 RepID=UPI003CCA0603